MNSKLLAWVGIGLYICQVLSSASSSGGDLLAPVWLILFSGTASIAWVIIAAIWLWRGGAKYMAIILPVLTVLSALAPVFQTPESSNLNLVFNVFRVGSFLTYFYVVFLLFAIARERRADSLNNQNV